jgi:addiction module RelE/StbE family toxin
MKIRYHKDFNKAFLKLSPQIRDKVKKTLEIFQKDKHHPLLDNHALHGKFQGSRSISVGGDLRLVFDLEGNYERVIFILVGTHTQLYR